jgi:hypothetical protein
VLKGLFTGASGVWRTNGNCAALASHLSHIHRWGCTS